MDNKDKTPKVTTPKPSPVKINSVPNFWNIPDAQLPEFKDSPTESLGTNLGDAQIGHTDFGESKYDKNYSASLQDIATGDYKYNRGEQQNGFAQLGLGVLRAIAKAGVEIAKTPGYAYALGASWGDQTLDQTLDNAWLNGLESLDQKIKDELPVYQSYKSGKGGILDNIASTSFWASDGADGVGYLLGMMAPGAALKGIGMAGKLAKLGVPTKGLLSASNLELGTQTVLNSSLEAMAEAKGVADQLKAKGVAPEKIADAAYDTFMANMGLLMIPNAIMNKNLLGRFSKDKSLLDNFARTADGQLTSNPIAKKGIIKEYAKTIGSSMASEGLMEEGGQTAIQNYEQNKALGKTNKGFIEGVASEYVDMLGTLEGQKAVLLGSVLGSIGGATGQYREDKATKKALPTLADLINKNFAGFSVENDVYKRDEKGNIVINPKTNEPVVDIKKATDTIINYARESKLSQEKDLAALANDKTLHDYIASEQFTRYAIPFIQQGEAGLQILNEHLDNVSKTQHLMNEKTLAGSKGVEFEEGKHKADLKNKAKELSKIYDSTMETIKGLDFLTKIPGIDPKVLNEHINTIANAVFQENSKQLFLNETIHSLTTEANQIAASLSADLPQNQREVVRIHKEINGLKNLLDQSKEYYETLFDPAQHEAVLKSESKKAAETKIAEQQAEEATKAAKAAAESQPTDASYDDYDYQNDTDGMSTEELVNMANQEEPEDTTTVVDIETKKADIERRIQGLNGIEEIVFSNPNFRLEGFEIDGNYWNVVTSTDRAKVLVNINGVIVPFYLTTGQAGKGLVPGWYPFFGIGKDGWLNKTDKSDMETYYERYWGKETSDIVKSISEELNGFYGTDPSNFKNDGDPNATSRPLSTLADKVEDYINSKLNYTPATNNADARKTLRSNVEQLGKEINAKYDAELATLEGKPASTIISEEEEEALNDVSASVVDTDRNTPDPVNSEDLETNLDSNKFLSANRTFATMMSLFKMAKSKFWERDARTGEVKRDNNSNVTSKVNNPNFATVGSEVEFKITKVSPEGNNANLNNIEASRKSITAFRKKNPNGPYTQEDEDFTANYLVDPIGIYSEGELIGFVQIPHYIPYDENDKGYEGKLAVRKALIETRKDILSGKHTKSKITVKGAGKLLTRIDGSNKPMLNPIPAREQDTFDGISLYVYDNGTGVTPFGEIEDLFLEDLDKVKQFQIEYQNKSIQKNKIFKVVTASNGSYRLIPVYTSKLNATAVDKVVAILKTADLSNFDSQKQLVKELQDYVFATSTSNEKYKHVINAIKIDNNNGTIQVAGNVFQLEDIANNRSIKLLKESLSTLSHNINGIKINTEEYQNMLNENGTLQTNAYIDNKSGEFFVQPYIEFAPFTNQEVDTEAKDVSSSISDPSNREEDDIADIDFTQGDNSDPFSTTKFDGNLEKAHKVLSKIVPGISFADVKEVAKVAPHVKDAYGMYRNMLIYLFEGATDKTAYHEAFHGVFRNMLSDNSRTAILKEAASKYAKPSSNDISELRNLPGNKSLSDSQLTELYYEEKLADEFAEFLDFKVNRSLGRKILDFFKDIFKMFNIFSKHSTSQIETLFESVSSGKFATVSKLANRYIDTRKFNTVAYTRVTKDINLPTQLERTKSIANQFLAKYNAALASGTVLTNKEQENIFEEIKQQYKEIFLTENAKPKAERNVAVWGISNKIYKNFNAFIEEARKEIAKRNIKLVGNLSSITTDVETGENEDGESQENDENLSQGNESREFGQEMTSISGIRSATHALKLYLSSIPIIENGKVSKDSYGFDQYHRFESLYYYLEKQLAFEGVISFDQIVKILNEAAKYRPEYKQILDGLDAISVAETRDSFKRQFASNFSKQVLNYKLVTFTKRNDAYSFKIFDPNRKNVKIDLREKWRGSTKSSNLQNPSNTIMDKYRYYDEQHSMYRFDAEGLKELLKEVNTKDYTLDEFNTLTRSIGIDFDPATLALAYEKDKKELVQNVRLFLNGVINNNTKDLRNSVNSLINKNIVATTELFTSSFNNVENSVVYAIQNQSFASRLAKKLGNRVSASKFKKELERDPLYKYNTLLRYAIEDPGKYEMFYYDGLKAEGDNVSGNKFNQIHEEDYEAVAINLFLNEADNENSTIQSKTALYSPITPAEKLLSAIYKGPSYHVTLNEDGKTIKEGSEIVNLFYGSFLNEAGRIKSALLDKKNNVKPIINYHHKAKSKPDAWDGNAYDIHSVHLQKDTLADLIKYLDANLEDTNALENLSAKNAELFNKIRSEITNLLNKEIADQLKKFTKSNVIVEVDGKLTSKFIKTAQPLNQVVADFTLNSWLFNINNSMLNNGDPAFYKNSSDWGKRFYQSLSMTKKMDMSQIDGSFKHIKDGKIKFNVLNDYETATKAGGAIRELMQGHPDFKDVSDILANSYEKSGSVNVTDAQVLVSEALYRELKRAIGDTSEGLEIIKPFVYGTQWSEELKRYIPVQIKCAIFPLTDEYVKNNELLKSYKDKMDKQNDYPQAIAFNSAFKAIAPTPGVLNGGDTFIDISLESFGYQVDNRDHSIDSDNSSMRQLKMLMYGIMDNNTEYAKDEKGNKLTGEQIKNVLLELESANLIEANDALVNMFNKDKKALNSLISEAVTKRNSTSVVESIFAVKPDGEFEYNLDLTGHTQVIQMISSLFSKRAILQSFKGGAYVQASSLGYRGKNLAEQQSKLSAEELKLQSDLQWIKQDPNDPDSIDYIDIAVTAPSKEFYKHVNDDGTIKDSLPEELRRMLVYRIPNEGAHSDMVCRIKYILPEGYKNTILMPYEVTKQFGADFDFDKTYFIYKHSFNKKDGSFTIPKYNEEDSKFALEKRYKQYVASTLRDPKFKTLYKEYADHYAMFADGEDFKIASLSKDEKIQVLFENNHLKSVEEFSELPISLQNSKEARDNKIIDLYMSLLRNKNMLKSTITPSGAGQIEDFYNEYDMKSDAKNGNFWTFRNQAYLKDLFHSISRLKGAAALHVTGHAWATNGNLKLKTPIRVLMGDRMETYDDLSRVMSDKGNKIVEELSSMMAAILDAVKTPELLPSLGINDQSMDLWATIVRSGAGVELASAITSQIGVKHFTRNKIRNFKKLKGDNFKVTTIEDTLEFYKQKYVSLYDQHIKGTDFEKSEQGKWYVPEQVNKSSAIHYKNVLKYSQKERNLIEYLRKDDSVVPPIERIEFLKTQIEVLNMVGSLEATVNEVKQLNNLFSINKEVGPNFEDINQKLLIVQSIRESEEPAILGKESILDNKLIKSYLDIFRSTFDVINEHFMFASKTFNEIKSNVAFSQNVNSSPLKLNAQNRDLINNFTRMFLDSTKAFKEVYDDTNDITEKEFMYEIEKILLSTNDAKKEDTFEYKLFGNRMLTTAEKQMLRNTGVLSQVKIASIPNSDKKYLNLKGNRLELAEKELFIGSLISLYKDARTKKLAENIVKYTFKLNGFYTGLNSFANLIHPEIAVGMGLQDNRNFIKDNIDNLKQALDNEDIFDRIKDQVIRNYPQKFTKVFDNNSVTTFTENSDGGITLNMGKSNNRIKEILLPFKESYQTVQYLRFMNKAKLTKLYKYDPSKSSEGLYVYTPVSMLGHQGLYVEINPFSDLEESELPTNNYKPYAKKAKLKDGATKTIYFGKNDFKDEEDAPVTEEGINTTKGAEVKPTAANKYNIDSSELVGVNTTKGEDLEVDSDMPLGDLEAEFNADTPLVEGPKKSIESNLPGSETKINIYAGTGENTELSNFAIRPFIISGDEYQSVEQYFQYQKWNYLKEDVTETQFKEDQKIADAIMDTSNGATLKSLGRKFKNLDAQSWDKDASKEMKIALKTSFEQNPKALEALLATGNAELTHTQDKGKWGKEFPKLLMEVRKELGNNLDSASEMITFESSFTKEEQDIIIGNFLKKYKIPRNESSIATARKSLNSEIKKDSVKTLELIKKCYL